ncbi:OsmC family protein [Corynebacterium crudilactis]|uniref:Osmotically inducible protein C n=1 Tax=Corynebacterium crudilactis TaxID=1652495 RepID=A0A172QSI3_9CORY|nr:OsmC family protein [Corynebacterium crudilactis]ANE03655.1 osmotically inducible protein C [Corynebacterium crudilactis]
MTSIKATRTSPNTYTVVNDSGAQLHISTPGVPGTFSPAELLQAAVAGCASLSAEAQLAHHLGPDFQATATVDSTESAGLITDLLFQLQVDLQGLDPAAQDKLLASTAKKIDRLCAIKRSIHNGINTQTVIVP